MGITCDTPANGRCSAVASVDLPAPGAPTTPSSLRRPSASSEFDASQVVAGTEGRSDCGIELHGSPGWRRTSPILARYRSIAAAPDVPALKAHRGQRRHRQRVDPRELTAAGHRGNACSGVQGSARRYAQCYEARAQHLPREPLFPFPRPPGDFHAACFSPCHRPGHLVRRICSARDLHPRCEAHAAVFRGQSLRHVHRARSLRARQRQGDDRSCRKDRLTRGEGPHGHRLHRQHQAVRWTAFA